MSASTLKIGVVGIGNMGSAHAKSIYDGNINNLQLVAFCDIDESKREWGKIHFGDTVKGFSNYNEMIEQANLDAVLIATPHYLHPEIAIDAFSKNLHVLCEKPAGVYTKQVEAMNQAARKAGTVFSMMYNQRTNPMYQEMKSLISLGKLGAIKRMVWIVTNWYRTQAYYDSGSWRGTWAGEGGGVLMNQCPHNLDLWQWFLGMPITIRATCNIGKYHNIEVEDDVSAFAEYENGATATFITSTGECPGTNRLEISGERGKAVLEGGQLIFHELSVSEREHCFSSHKGYGVLPATVHHIKSDKKETAHNGILQNFTNAILYGEPLIAPGEEGIKAVTLANAMYLSSATNKTISLPLDADLYWSFLQEKIKHSKVVPDYKSTLSDSHGTHSNRWNVK